MTDVIHKVLNDITDEWAIIIGGDSHTRMSKGLLWCGPEQLPWLATVRLQCQFQSQKLRSKEI
jgi:aconitase B